MIVRGLEDNKKKMELKHEQLQNALTEISASKRRDLEDIENKYVNLTEGLKKEITNFGINEEKYQKKVFFFFFIFSIFNFCFCRNKDVFF
jgi:predicted component of viral defense system (DUF524 family)